MLTIIQILLLTCKNHDPLNLPRQIYAFLVCHVNQPREAPLNFLQECAVWVTEQFVGIEPE